METGGESVTVKVRKSRAKKGGSGQEAAALPSPSPSLIPITNRRPGITAAHSIDMDQSFVLPNPPSAKSSSCSKLVTKE